MLPLPSTIWLQINVAMLSLWGRGREGEGFQLALKTLVVYFHASYFGATLLLQ